MRTCLLLGLVLTACSGAPVRLSETGLYADLSQRMLAPGVIEFSPRYPLWTDGAKKRRWAFLPAGTQIDVSDPDRWVFPVGAKLWKEFEAEGLVLETRYLEKTSAGWRFESYVWDADGNEARGNAFLGATNVRGTKHDVPGQGNCTFCHGDVEAPLGFTAVQLAGSNPGLESLNTNGWLSSPLTELAPLSEDPEAASALGGLHANCGGCHSDSGRQSDNALRLRLRTTDRARADTGFFQTAIGQSASRTIDGRRTYVVAGDPSASLLFHRLSSRGVPAQMPPVGTKRLDDGFVARVRDFISSLPVDQ